MLHLEGMGVLGSYLAHRLFDDGIPFTWNDTDEPITAWKACTGAIFPTGHADDQLAMEYWREHLYAGWPWLEEADYVFSTKAPPHGGRYGFQSLAGDVKLAEVSSLHLNAQEWVPWTRHLFGPARRERMAGQQLVVTHGFGARLDRFMWGWTVPVRIETTASSGRRPSIYFRRGRFVMAYAYPIAGTDMWYAGSSLISQRVPNPLEEWPKFERWERDFRELGEGYITGVTVAGNPRQGWRPVPDRYDTEWVRRMPDGSLAVKPLWHSGVRHAPLVYDALKEALS